MMHVGAKAYREEKFPAAVQAGRLLAELTGALAPEKEEDRSVDIAEYLQLQPTPRAKELLDDSEDDS